MKTVSLINTTKLLFTLFVLFTTASMALGADPGRPDREADDARRPLSSDQRPGSILVYNIYASTAADPGKQDTDISLTNVNSSQPAYAHIFFIAEGCSTADTFVCLTPNQTASFLASDVDPGVKGYVIVIASNNKGCPISFNYLIGSEYVKFETGHAANLAAESYAALYNGTLPGCTVDTTMARVPLDGVRYTAAPRLLAADKIPTSVSGNSTMLILNSLDGNLAIGMNLIRNFSGVLYDDVENAFAFSGTGNCQFRSVLSDAFPVTTPKFSQVIPAGRTGWMSMMAREERAISGAIINFNPNAATQKGAFNGGHNLFHLRYTGGELLVPVFELAC
ncbi:MAG TPA: hypothetical protein PLK30_15760 [Blastocatellia bacterium]|nr:hypothetical protein [Blastocatellia bacterium]